MPASPSTCPIPWFTPAVGPTPCGAELAAGEHVCGRCVADFSGRLRGDVPDALEALLVTISRGDRFRRDVVRRARDDDHDPKDEPELGAHGRLPLRLDALQPRDALVKEVAQWRRRAFSCWSDVVLQRDWRGIPFAYPRPLPPPTETVAAAAWLADVVEHLRGEVWLPTMVVRIDRRVRKAFAVCDRPDDRVRVQCPVCGTDVRLSTDPEERIDCRGWIPTPDGSRVRCEQWGLQRWWVERCKPQREPVRAGLIPLRLEAHGYHVTGGAVRNWIHRKQLAPVGTDKNGHATYDLTQAVLLAEEKAQRRRAGRAV